MAFVQMDFYSVWRHFAEWSRVGIAAPGGNICFRLNAPSHHPAACLGEPFYATTMTALHSIFDPIPAKTGTVLLPFDVGRTFIFHPQAPERPKDQPAPGPEWVDAQWRQVFAHLAEKDWDYCRQFRKDIYHKPLSWVAAIPLDNDPEARTLKDRCAGIITTPGGISAIFFPLGIAMLRIRMDLSDVGAAQRDFRRFTTSPDLRGPCAKLMQSASAVYVKCMDSAAAKPRKGRTARSVRELVHVARSHGIHKPCNLTIVVFQLDPPQVPLVHERFRESTYAGAARVKIGWETNFVNGGKPEQWSCIEAAFMIATASWYALSVMNRLSSLYLLESVSALADDHSIPTRTRSRAVRFTYMEGANSSYPIRWTDREADLLLLEAIHGRWGTRRWWRNVDERTDLLSVHHDAMEADAAERRGIKLSIIGLVFGGAALLSASTDVLQLRQSTTIPESEMIRGIAVPILIALLLWLWYIASEWPHQSARRAARKHTQT